MNRDGFGGSIRDKLGIQPEETRIAVSFFLLFFFVMLPVYINKTVKEALLIHYVEPSWWPVADLVTAALIGLVVALNARLLKRLPKRNYISTVFVFFMTHLFVFWMIFDFKLKKLSQTPILSSGGYIWMIPVWWPLQYVATAPLAIVFSFWTDVFIATSVTHYWLAVNDVFFPHQARRLIGFFIGGGLLGGITGALLSLTLAKPLGTENLLLVSMWALVLTLVSLSQVYREKKKLPEVPAQESPATGPKGGFLESARAVLTSRHLRLISGLMAASMIVATLIGFQFKTVVLASWENPNERTMMLALFFIFLLAASAVFHFLLTNWILGRKEGILLALSLAPLALVGISTLLFVLPAASLTAWAFLGRGTDKLLDNTLSQSGRELLYVPIRPELKFRGKILIDMFVNRAAIAVGAILLLALIHLGPYKEALEFGGGVSAGGVPAYLGRIGGPLRAIGILVILFSLVWIGLARLVHKENQDAITEGIKDLMTDGVAEIAKRDPDEAKRIADLIQSLEISPSLFLMNLYSIFKKGELSPELRDGLLDLVREGKLLDEIKGFSPKKPGKAALPHPDAILDLEGTVPPAVMDAEFAEEDLRTTLGRILADERYQALMESHVARVVENPSSSDVEKIIAAKLIGQLKPTPRLSRILENLLMAPSPDVRHYALESAGIHQSEEHLPLIISQLNDPATRPAAREALIRYGPAVLKTLAGMLSDPEEKAATREAIPEVLAGLGSPAAIDHLISELGPAPEGLEGEIIGALGQVRLSRPDFIFSPRKVKRAVLALLQRYRRAVLESARRSGEALSGRSESARNAHLRIEIRRIFDLLSLTHSREEMIRAFSNIILGTPSAADSSLALLDNCLETKIKEALFPLIEKIPEDERIRRLIKLEKKSGKNLLRSIWSMVRARSPRP